MRLDRQSFFEIARTIFGCERELNFAQPTAAATSCACKFAKPKSTIENRQSKISSLDSYQLTPGKAGRNSKATTK
jgi:hypothetical protein